MSDKNDMDHHCAVILEDVNHKFDAIMESQKALAGLPNDVAQLKKDMVGVKADIATIKLAVKGQSKDHNALVKQVTKRWNKR